MYIKCTQSLNCVIFPSSSAGMRLPLPLPIATRPTFNGICGWLI